MKFLLALILSTATYAATINCQSYYQVEYDLGLDVEMSFDLKPLDDGSFEITNRQLDFAVDADSINGSWYDFTGKSQLALVNNVDYKPRKYQGYSQFDYTSDLEALDGGDGFFGYVDFLMPTKSLKNLKSGDKFKSIIIMSWVSDHWGGTRTLSCEVTSLSK